MTIKFTKLGKQLYDLIQASDGHMTADQIHTALKERDVRMGIATVYRNLNALYDKRLINRVRHPELGFIYDKNVHDHYHFRCVKCNKIQDVEISFQSQIHKEVEDTLGVVVLTHDMNFEGICADCLQLDKKS